MDVHCNPSENYGLTTGTKREIKGKWALKGFTLANTCMEKPVGKTNSCRHEENVKHRVITIVASFTLCYNNSLTIIGITIHTHTYFILTSRFSGHLLLALANCGTGGNIVYCSSIL